jgi:uncharacterized membrane protein YhaH (DUF805 family)
MANVKEALLRWLPWILTIDTEHIISMVIIIIIIIIIIVILPPGCE